MYREKPGATVSHLWRVHGFCSSRLPARARESVMEAVEEMLEASHEEDADLLAAVLGQLESPE